MQKGGVFVTMDPFSGTKASYGKLYAALAQLPAIPDSFIGPQETF